MDVQPQIVLCKPFDAAREILAEERKEGGKLFFGARQIFLRKRIQRHHFHPAAEEIFRKRDHALQARGMGPRCGEGDASAPSRPLPSMMTAT